LTSTQTRNRGRATLLVAAAVIAALVILFFIFVNFYTDFLWFDQLGYASVLTTQWTATAVMFAIGFLAMAVPVWAAIQIAFRWRPVYAKLNSQLDHYQQMLEPLRKVVMYGVPILFGFFAGVAAASRWTTVLEWLNRTETGTTDPQFHLDLAFYFFDLPFYRAAVGFGSAVVLLAGLAGLATLYLYGGLRVGGREIRISRPARVQLAVTAFLYLALQAISVWLDQYDSLTAGMSSHLTGASYADVNATIPGREILAGIAAIVAILFLITAFIGRWRLPLVGTALLVVSAILVGMVYPWVIQKFQVDPSAKELEASYIQRNIDATRAAYGVADVKEVPYAATTDAKAGALKQDAQTTASIRIMDPALISPSVAQLEQFKQYYQFAPILDVDRYQIDGKTQDTVIGVRELDQRGIPGAGDWYNDTVVYTHGYGVVAAYGNQRSADGLPVFMESGIPVSGVLGDFEPRIYFGEKSPAYSIVGAPEGSKPIELDYPAGDKEGDQSKATTFTGDGGPKLDNVFNKLAYAIKFQSEQIFLSNAVNDKSQILYDRDPKTRVQKVAPYLTLDSDPYPAIVDGRVQWIVDGYTTSANYPYSKIEQLSNAIADTYTPKPLYAFDDVNYIRNSVKATVDAYDGKVTLYAWDATDPLLQTWQKIFPNTVKPMSDMSAQLLSHVRYPADLFKVQRAILGTYHVTDPGTFYSNNDAWVTPNDPTVAAGQEILQTPYYLTMKIPGADKPSFSLYSTYIPYGTTTSTRNVLTGYLAVDADAGSTPGQISPDYGKLTLLTLPSQSTVPGPGQVQNNFSADPTVSQALNLLRQGKTTVKSGNLLTLPVGGGLLYVQPVYIESTGETHYPILQKVLVAFGDKIAFEDTLDAALDTLFGGDSGANAGDEDIPPTSGEGTGDENPPPTETPEENPALQKALSEAKAALAAREAAFKAGDLTAYAKADEQLQQALQDLFIATGSGQTGGQSSGEGDSSQPNQ